MATSTLGTRPPQGSHLRQQLHDIRRLEVGGMDSSSRVNLSLELRDADPTYLRLCVMLKGLDLILSHETWDEESEVETIEFEVRATGGLRALGRAIEAMADRAEQEGMFAGTASA